MINDKFYNQSMDDVKMLLDGLGYNYTEEYIDLNLSQWRENKYPIFAMLSKSKAWDARRMAVIVNTSCMHTVTANEVMEAARNLCRECWHGGTIEEWVLMRLHAFDSYAELGMAAANRSSNFEPDAEYNKNWNKMPDLCDSHKYPDGKKKSRVATEICKATGMDTHENFSKAFAKFSDMLKGEYEEKIKLVFSIHPCDFLSQSHGNSWDSCHKIYLHDQGCYSAGSVSYMVDKTSLVAYVDLSEDTDTPWMGMTKRNREMIFVEFVNNIPVFVTSRLYHNDDDSQLKDAIRIAFEKVISEAGNIPNQWRTKTSGFSVERGRGSSAYPDYECMAYLKYVYNSVFFDHAPITKFYAGGQGYCTICGHAYSMGDQFTRDCCRNHGGEIGYCIHCNETLYEGSDYTEDCDGNLCCDNCRDNSYVYVCEDCGRFVDYSEACEDNYGNAICQRCFDNNYWICDGCEHICRDDDAHIGTHNGNYICEDCYSDDYFTCEDCGEVFLNRDAQVLADGRCICDGCYEDGDYFECEDCGAIYHISEGAEIDGEYYCKTCYADHDDETDEPQDAPMLDAQYDNIHALFLNRFITEDEYLHCVPKNVYAVLHAPEAQDATEREEHHV